MISTTCTSQYRWGERWEKINKWRTYNVIQKLFFSLLHFFTHFFARFSLNTLAGNHFWNVIRAFSTHVEWKTTNVFFFFLAPSKHVEEFLVNFTRSWVDFMIESSHFVVLVLCWRIIGWRWEFRINSLSQPTVSRERWDDVRSRKYIARKTGGARLGKYS